MPGELNTFTVALARACTDRPLDETWLVAPSLRVGYQWLDAITRVEIPLLGVRVTTLRQLAWQLAAPELARSGLSSLSAQQAELLIGQLFVRSRAAGVGRRSYLGERAPSVGLVRALARAVHDLRLAGLRSDGLAEQAFEVREKGREVRRLLAAFEAALEERGLADHADLLTRAAARLAHDVQALAPRARVLCPADQVEALTGLERRLWRALPRAAALPVDPAGGALAAAPRVFRAMGEASEVREVLRRCLEEEIPLDEVELLHTDASTYVPLIYELLCARAPWSDRDPGPAATFAEGLPASLFRPGRALCAWLQWQRFGLLQSTLVRMLQDGLLKRPAEASGEERQLSFVQLAALLRAAPVGAGAGRYLAAVDEQLAATRVRGDAGAEEGLRQLRALLEPLLKPLLEGQGDQGRLESPRALLAAAARFMERHARVESSLDEYARRALLRSVHELAGGLEGFADADLPTDLVWDWLTALPEEVRVGGEGPRPGRLHVAALAAGGHAGRAHAFVVGLDDGRFPGGGQQDPLLLDRERGRLGPDLPTSASRLAARAEALHRLVARLRPRSLTLSHSCVDLAADRERFPASALVSLQRGSTAPAVSVAPTSSARCLDRGEWWLWRLCAGGAATTTAVEPLIAAAYPHLGRGARARRARASDAFTAYDGHVPQAGRDLDPFRADGPVLSATRLEALGRCPLTFFFEHVLQIAPPAAHEHDPERWLDPLQRGALLHDIFCRFMRGVQERGRPPKDGPEDRALLEGLLQRALARARRRWPPPSAAVARREEDELGQTLEVFLREEQLHCRTSEPLYFEVAVGSPALGQGTPLDCAEPAVLRLPSGTIRAQGLVDRVDRVGRRAEAGLAPTFAIWDYKTGSAWAYRDRAVPFKQGRLVQSALYLELVEERLQALPGLRGSVASFGYFFPGLREYGARVSWTRAELAQGRQVLDQLCRLLQRGCFPCSDDPDDLSFSPYRRCVGDGEAATAATLAKLSNPDNTRADGALAPFAELRGHGPDGHGSDAE
jgi:PD-(D/E)XK nuclease superfamily